jgi:signal transduction histidine kinase
MRLSLLIEDVLQVSQIESGNVHCLHEPFDLRAEVTDLVRTWPGAAAVELDDGDVNGPIRAVGDAARTRQVLVNLLENAERHARDANAPVRIHVGRNGRSVQAVVADAGPGIPPEAQDRIFERFVRLGQDSTGTGLGLYISRRLAEAQGGTLHVESVPGRGATFTFALPADAGTDDP